MTTIRDELEAMGRKWGLDTATIVERAAIRRRQWRGRRTLAVAAVAGTAAAAMAAVLGISLAVHSHHRVSSPGRDGLMPEMGALVDAPPPCVSPPGRVVVDASTTHAGPAGVAFYAVRVHLFTRPRVACRADVKVTLRLEDRGGHLLGVDGNPATGEVDDILAGGPQTVEPEGPSSALPTVNFQWSNWCGAAAPPDGFAAVLAWQGQTTTLGITPPGCLAAGQRSSLGRKVLPPPTPQWSPSWARLHPGQTWPLYTTTPPEVLGALVGVRYRLRLPTSCPTTEPIVGGPDAVFDGRHFVAVNPLRDSLGLGAIDGTVRLLTSTQAEFIGLGGQVVELQAENAGAVGCG